MLATTRIIRSLTSAFALTLFYSSAAPSQQITAGPSVNVVHTRPSLDDIPGNCAIPSQTLYASSRLPGLAGNSPFVSEGPSESVFLNQWSEGAGCIRVQRPSVPEKPCPTQLGCSRLGSPERASETCRGGEVGCVAAGPSFRADSVAVSNLPRTVSPTAASSRDASPDYRTFSAHTSGELESLGAPGLKIERARREVLDILDTPNACSEWFATSDPHGGDTFSSLTFQVDRRGAQDTFESRQQSLLIFRQPYVARSTQDAGSFSEITINANGAFYRAQGRVQKVSGEGGPTGLDGARILTVGPYFGDTAAARMVTLLHELGHIVNLLPEDSDGADGSSARNTSEVLRHCKPEVDAHAKLDKQLAKH